MNITVFKEDIIEGLQKAASILPQRTGAAFLRSIWLKAENGVLELLATDSNLEFRGSYSAEITENGLAGVQGKAFVELLRRLPSGKISIQLDEKASVVHIEQGRRKYKLAANDATWFQEFADFPEEGAVIWSGDYVQELIERLVFCIADEGLDAISCLLLKPAADNCIEAVGMNGHQFSMVRFSHDDLRALLPEEGLLVQKKYVNEVKKWLGTDEIDLNIGEKRLFLRTADKKESFSLPLSAYSYPDYTPFVSRVNGQEGSRLLLDRLEASDALQRILIFNSDSNRCATFSLSAEEAVLTAAGQDVGSATEALDISYNGSVGKIAFPTHNLLTILDHFASEKLSFTLTASEGPCGITGESDPDYLVILMPMKISDDIQLREEQV